MEILKGLKKHYEEHHQLTYTDASLGRQVGGKAPSDLYFLDKAFDVVDETELRATGRGQGRRGDGCGSHHCPHGSHPPQERQRDEKRNLGDPEADLKTLIYGQTRP